MSSYNSYNEYSSSTTYSYYDYETLRNIIIIVAAVVQVVGALMIYGCIRCCCPTSLKRLRPGMVLSDGVRVGQSMQPFVIQNVMPNAEPVQMGNLQPMPPPYLAQGWTAQAESELTPKGNDSDAARIRLIGDSS